MPNEATALCTSSAKAANPPSSRSHPRVARTLDLAADERGTGPLLLTRTGRRMDRYAASRIVHRLAKKAGMDHRVGCQSLRDVQIVARHADPRTTARYDRARWTGTPTTSLPPSSPEPPRSTRTGH